MPNALTYVGYWKMADDTTQIQININDLSVYSDPGDDPEIITLQMGKNPLVISVIDNDRDKLSPIRSKQAKIEIMTENGVDITSFSGGADNRFYVEIFIYGTGTYLFKGFLVAADLSQPFLPHKQTLVLTASDCLGLLKDVPLTTDGGVNPTGKHRIIEFIAWCLQKTGVNTTALSSPTDPVIRAINNLRHGSGVLTNQALFSVAGQYIVTSGLLTDFFYAGQEITITNSVSNNYTTRVTSVDNSGAATVVYITTTITTGESTLGVVFTDTSSDRCFYDRVYLDAKTFESEIGECEDCDSVLRKILGEDCYITQYLGYWYIVRVDEYDENAFDYTEWDISGTFVSFTEDVNLDKSIGSGEDLRFVNADCLVERERPLSFSKETYNYETPKEVPCNVDFSHGSNEVIISSTESNFDVDCWTLREGYPGSYGTVDGTTSTLVVKYNSNGYENERYVKLTPRTTYDGGGWDTYTYIESEGIPVSEKDKFDLSIDYRLNLGIATGGTSPKLFRVMLFGDDGSYWVLGRPSDTSGSDDTVTWYDTSNFTTNSGRGKTVIDFDTADEEQWATIEWAVPPIPTDGTIYFWLGQFNQNSVSDDDKEVWYSNLRVEYNPYINGTYRKYSGQYQKVSRSATGYLNKRDNEVYISDSPKKLFKGAMFLLVNSAYILTTRFYAGNVYGDTYPGDGYCHPYGEIQIRSVWNQGVYPNWVFTGSVLGVDNPWPDVVHKYSLTDSHPASLNRYFLLLSFSQDWKTGIMESVFVEVFDRILLKTYSEDREFKYITQ